MFGYRQILFLLLLSGPLMSQIPASGYDKALADSLGSDEYGMKVYVLAILKTGTAVPESKEIRDSLFRGHMKNINQLAENKKLIVAGPLFENENKYRGIFILNVQTIEEAKKLIQTDPAVAAKLFDVDLYRWYGSAALPIYLDVHKRIEKKAP